jgi:hypothetical protein
MLTPPLQFLAVFAALTAVWGCTDSGSDPGSDHGEVLLQLSSRHDPADGGGQVEVASAAGQLVIRAGSDEIVVDRVGLVLRKIHLDGAPTATCPEDAEGDTQCAQVRLGPLLLDLPLDQAAEPTLDAEVPSGTYDRLRFQIHRPSNAAEDADLVAEHPEMDGISILVVGTYNATPFTFGSDLTEVENLSLPEGIEVAADGLLPITLRVDLAGWFLNPAGTGLLDPAQADDGGSLEAQVKQNIRASFRAFRDIDADGAAD